jgi:hypothetical protein
MTRDDLLDALAALAERLNTRVEVWRVIVDEQGQPTGQRIYRGAFHAPPDWQPPTLEDLIARARGRRDA